MVSELTEFFWICVADKSLKLASISQHTHTAIVSV